MIDFFGQSCESKFPNVTKLCSIYLAIALFQLPYWAIHFLQVIVSSDTLILAMKRHHTKSDTNSEALDKRLQLCQNLGLLPSSFSISNSDPLPDKLVSTAEVRQLLQSMMKLWDNTSHVSMGSEFNAFVKSYLYLRSLEAWKSWIPLPTKWPFTHVQNFWPWSIWHC